jgi:hypothetical protein
MLPRDSSVLCWYNEDWVQQLETFAEHKRVHPNLRTPYMLGRLMVSIALVCNGYDVFFSDTDVIFFRDPLKSISPQSDVTVSATAVPADSFLNSMWADRFFGDYPDWMITLNNGVAHFRSNENGKVLLLELALRVVRNLPSVIADWYQIGYLQMEWNTMMHENQLVLYR